ncbi:LytR/AlgR family response regulator transcription factor [Velocimicrobium porci]|uniref:Stage 0 sporulation protein A homolog n=1 Tax=Velocimicrobium porci TaxID=2606634 RepID=A0A6L5Y0G0_9FIRM|nr:LytTR family DNA-binding domain-containing protein [Velocimicrobium porci]MSS64201.1 response regulator transcription factor [Velocimicrobium porci]
MDMISICICDDNIEFLEYFKKMLILAMKELDVEFVVECYTDAKQLLFELDELNKKIDIYFLDILIKEENGIQLAREIRKRSQIEQIIFFSMNKEYVFDCFDVMPLHYLLKEQLTLEDLKEVLNKAISIVNENKKKLFRFKKGHSFFQIPLNEILYFEVMNRVVTIHMKGRNEEFYSTMEQIEEKIDDECFVRVHRSFLVNMNWVDRIERNKVSMFNEEVIPIGAKYSKNVKNYMKLLLEKM